MAENGHASPPAAKAEKKVPSVPAKARHFKQADRKELFDEAVSAEDQELSELLKRIAARYEGAELERPAVEVRYENLTVESRVHTGSHARPSVFNAYWGWVEACAQLIRLKKKSTRRFTMLKDANGIISPGRICLLLGPPGSGKSTLLKGLAGELSSDLEVEGAVTYNGQPFKSFQVSQTAAYVPQTDSHMAQLTVRETFDFGARVQGTGTQSADLEQLREHEEETGTPADPHLDAFMQAQAMRGKKNSVNTEFLLHLLGLGPCADTIVGNVMIRGVSGGQRKRVTTGEMLAGPKRVLLMDEITSGLDSATAFKEVKALRDMAHTLKATMLISLLQPTPEIYNLFDDILVLSEGHVIFHGPRGEVMPFFNQQGFQLAHSKDPPTFLQEVTSRKDQQQFWARREAWNFVPVDRFAQAFQMSPTGMALAGHLATPYDTSHSHPNALVQRRHALSGLQAFKACFRREWIITKRHLSVYKLRTVQIAIVAIIAATLYLRTHIHDHTLEDGTLLSGFLFYSVLVMMFNGITELALTIERLPVFYKHYRNQFYPAWAFVLPATILRIPFSLVEAVLWSALTYFEVGLTPDPGRFFAFMCLLFLEHQFSVSFFRLVGAICRNVVIAFGAGSLALITVLMLGGFAIDYNTIHWGWRWFCWANPIFYAQRGIIVNEFSAPRWQSQLVDAPGFPAGTSLGNGIMESRGFATHRWWTWLGMGALGAAILICQLGIILAHAFLKPLGNGPKRMSDQALEDRELACHGLASRLSSDTAAIKPQMLSTAPKNAASPAKPATAANWVSSSTFEPAHAHAAARMNGVPDTAPAGPGHATGNGMPGENGIAAEQGRPRVGHGLPNGYELPACHGEQSTGESRPCNQDRVLVGGLHPDPHHMSSINISDLMSTAPDLEQGGLSTTVPGWQTSMLGSDIQLLKTHPAYHSTKKLGPAAAASGTEGMVLPFTPAVMTFKNVNYYADPPPMIVKKIKSGKLKPPNLVEHGKKVQMQLLANVSGAFRPGILTCLFGISGAGKTTLLDVLACRKTGGRWDGDVRVDGHPQQKETFARISGYAQQFDIHSPQATVREALMFSARCRLSKEHSNSTVLKFVQEIERLVELDVIRDSVVGVTGISGLSTEQRKRLTIAVELVANPAIVFMDEPTTGLDARAAAIVMRTIRNVVNTGRTMVATIHQPSIDIFESFDELLLLMRGGRTIYWGPLGPKASKLFEHFELNPKVPKHTPGINPATWVLTTTSLGMMKKLGTNYAMAYAKSSLNKQNMELIERLSQPKEGSSPVQFATRHSLSAWGQYRTCFLKFLSTHWHNPNYNGTRYAITVTVALVFGTVFWKDGQNVSSAARLFNSVGAVYVTVLNLGVINGISVQPGLFAERFVFYREHRAGYYSALPWYLANASVQFIFILAQAILYVCIVYFMAGFKKDVEAFFWFLLFMLLTLLYFTFYGSLAVFVTGNLRHANILGSTFYTTCNLFAGFAIAPPSIPGWWIWFYWINPNAHTVYGLISTQFLESTARVDVYGERVPLNLFIQERFGFHHSFIGYNVLVLCGWILVFLMAGALALRKLNFLKM